MAWAVLGIVTVGCSIPIGKAGDLRLVPSVRPDKLGSGFSAGGNIMGLNLGFAVGARCLGLVSSVQNNGRCVGVGVARKDDEEDPAPPNALMLSGPTGAREQVVAAPPIRDGEVEERGVSGGAKLFGVGLGVSMSGRCVGVTTALDGKGRCLGIGLRPRDDSEAAPALDPGGAAPTAGAGPDGVPTQAR